MDRPEVKKTAAPEPDEQPEDEIAAVERWPTEALSTASPTENA
jgi:hypothetical protein